MPPQTLFSSYRGFWRGKKKEDYRRRESQNLLGGLIWTRRWDCGHVVDRLRPVSSRLIAGLRLMLVGDDVGQK